ncbi:hypothetical protein NEFER03_1187 [Nematocida sp. LUAm3]|nr:hypothetical protein NEFER03_1187 [Nematocida sp. LUAm3]KAI5175796.1 hypothetical protein NEFER02_1665 [Nematocida sp. LUAm2]KAI5178292.1 hypothetical protein NEFER01_1459 [Nematocida sp. LUAm1]
MDADIIPAEKQIMPTIMSRSLLLVVFSMFYVTAVLCEMSDPVEVLVSIIIGVFSFLANVGNSSKDKLVMASALSSVIYFLPKGLYRAALAGFLSSYLQATAEIYAVHISLKPFRSDAVSLVNFSSIMQAAVCFFFLAFLPVSSIVNSFAFMVFSVSIQVFLVLLFVPVPPLEMVRKDRSKDPYIYGEIYQALNALFSGIPFAEFHMEYTEIVDVDTRKPLPLRKIIWAAIEKVNVSFLSIALLGVLSTSNSESAYLVIFSATTMFTWLHAQNSPDTYAELMILTLCMLLLFIVLVYDVSPEFVLIMACSIYLVPTESTFLAMDSRVIAISSSAQHLLATPVYCILLRKRLF